MASNNPSAQSEVVSLATTINADLEKNTRTPIDEESSETASIKADLEKQTPASLEGPSDAPAPTHEPQYPPKQETLLIMISLYFTMFLMALVSAARAELFGITVADHDAGPNDYRNRDSLHN